MTTTSEHTGTTRYLAPELVMSEESVAPTLSSDVYALGCLGLEVRGHGCAPLPAVYLIRQTSSSTFRLHFRAVQATG